MLFVLVILVSISMVLDHTVLHERNYMIPIQNYDFNKWLEK